MASARDRRTIVVVRHAKAAKHGETDHARPLTDRGRADAVAAAGAVGSALTGAAGPAVALVSSAARAEQTWRQVAAALPTCVQVEERVTDELFTAGVDDMLRLLRRLGDEVTTAVVVGHNPTMEASVEALAGDADSDARVELGERGMPTASVATLAYDGSWVDLDRGTCRLDGFDVGRG